MKSVNALAAIFFVALSSACSYNPLPENDPSDNFENLKIMAETHNANLLSKNKTNWIPGDLFPTAYGFEEQDYVVFSQVGVISLNPFFIRSTMVPEQYQTSSGCAPERSFQLLVTPDDKSFSQNGNKLTVNIKDAKAQVVFKSGYNCIFISNTQTVSLSIVGSLEALDTTDGVVHYAGNLDFSIELPNKQSVPMKLTELYYTSSLDAN